ncbi:hypothetical protein ACK36B_02600, partial [Aeromonas veronii]
ENDSIVTGLWVLLDTRDGASVHPLNLISCSTSHSNTDAMAGRATAYPLRARIKHNRITDGAQVNPGEPLPLILFKSPVTTVVVAMELGGDSQGMITPPESHA